MRIELGVDELTMVFLPEMQGVARKGSGMGFEGYLKGLVWDVCREMDLEGAFGPMTEKTDGVPAGYEKGFGFSQGDFYVALAYNSRNPGMGVVLKVSARALAYWISECGIEVPEILRRARGVDGAKARLSRVDLTCDYFDAGLEVNDIYESLLDGSLCVTRMQRGRGGKGALEVRAASRIEAYSKNGMCQTVYVGSRRKNVNALLRIYDKKAEQIENHGPQEKRARASKDWVRFEASFRHSYADDVGRAMEGCKDISELASLIGMLFVQRYRFRKVEEGEIAGYAPWYKALVDDYSDDKLVLGSKSWRRDDLATSLENVVLYSGLIPMLQKARAIWGDGSVPKIMGFIGDEADSSEVSENVRRWVKSRAGEYRGQYADVKDWLEDVGERMHPEDAEP